MTDWKLDDAPTGMTEYTVVYVGPVDRPEHEGQWFKRMESWLWCGQGQGSWRWVTKDEIPEGAKKLAHPKPD